MSTHYAVIFFPGDPEGKHPDEGLRGQRASLTLLAAGSERYCRRVLEDWTEAHRLRPWEEAEVLPHRLVFFRRDPGDEGDR